MSYNWNTRTELLFGAERMERLSRSHVLVVGLGGVGAYAAEQICRAGVGKMTIIDADTNPQLQLTVLNEFLRDERTEEVLLSAPLDFVVDAIDSLSPKVYLMYQAYIHKIPIVSSMGAGAKVDPSLVRIADISKTINCALAKAVRKRLRPLGVSKGIPVVFSTEFADPDAVIEVENETCKRTTTGTVSYMPATFGCFLASHVLRNLI